MPRLWRSPNPGAASGLDRPVELLVGDHQNKPDVGLAIVREWLSTDKADVIVDFANSAISLGAQPLALQYKVLLHVASTTSELAGKGCARNGIQWAQNNLCRRLWPGAVAAARVSLGTAVERGGTVIAASG